MKMIYFFALFPALFNSGTSVTERSDRPADLAFAHGKLLGRMGLAESRAFLEQIEKLFS